MCMVTTSQLRMWRPPLSSRNMQLWPMATMTCSGHACTQRRNRRTRSCRPHAAQSVPNRRLPVHIQSAWSEHQAALCSQNHEPFKAPEAGSAAMFLISNLSNMMTAFAAWLLLMACA